MASGSVPSPLQGTTLGAHPVPNTVAATKSEKRFCGSQTISVSAQTAVRDPCCLVRQTPHLH